MKIVIVVNRLTGGGLGLVTCDVASYWADHGHEVTAVTFAAPSFDRPVDPRVRQVDLYTGDVRRATRYLSWARQAIALRRAIRQVRPDVVVAMIAQANFLAIVSAIGLGIPLVGHEPVMWSTPRTRLARRLLYGRLQRLVLTTDRTRREARALLPDDKLAVAPAHLSPSFVAASGGRSAWDDTPGPRPAVRIVAAGRHVPMKGFDLLLRALARMNAPDWGLVLLGDGPERATLMTLTRELGLDARVHFTGWIEETKATLLDSDVFVFPSRREGWGIALLEAMSCGLAAVSFDCPVGPREMITHGVDGLLIPPEDVDALAQALTRVIGDAGLRKQLGAAAAVTARRFSLEKIGPVWSSVLPQPVG